MANFPSSSEFPDEVQSFSLENTNVRGRLVRLGKTYGNILNNHNYPIQVASLIGELTTMSICLADSLKYHGQFILQTQSTGPVNMMVANITSEGTLRSYARYDTKKFKNTVIQNTIPYLLGNGHIAFTIDQGADTERYQGIAPLEGSNLAECAQKYFRQSEQIDTTILLTSDPVKKRAAALMIQKMPLSDTKFPQTTSPSSEYDDENWRNAVILMSSTKTEELLDTHLESSVLLFRLFHESGVRLYKKKSLLYECQCSKEKLATILASFSPREIDSMKTNEGSITSNCEFCGTSYRFSDGALNAIRNNIIE